MMYKGLFGALAALVAVASAQDLAFIDGPKIMSVTPKDSGALIAFIPPTATTNTPEILEYNVECRVPGNNMMGTAVFTMDGNDKSVELYGLENGMEYICDMSARGATSGYLPRAINSPTSNTTPLFTPLPTVQATLFVEQAKAEPTAAPVPPTNVEAGVADAADVADAVVLPQAPTIQDVEMVSAGEAEIKFSLPAGDETSPVVSIIAACQHNSDASASSQATVPAGSTQVRITGLTQPGEWTCSVVAQTAQGIGKSATRIIEVENDGTVEAQDKPATAPEASQGGKSGAQGGEAPVTDAAITVFSTSVGAALVALVLAVF